MEQSDRYQLIERIGRIVPGATNGVWKARDTRLDRIVAIRILPPELIDSPDTQQFARRVSRLALLRDAGIVPVLELWRDNELNYQVMEYVEGQNLRQWIEARGRLGLEQTLAISRVVLNALDYAHRLGILHLDLRPSKILLSNNGRILLSGFSLTSKPRLDPGKPKYASPEQIFDWGRVDMRSDIYSFGCLLYFMLTGRETFSDLSLLPMPIGTVVMRCLESNPEERWSSCPEVLSMLDRMGSDCQIVLPPQASPDAPNPIDDDAQFTVYRPQSVRPESWKMLLAFAHRSSRPPDAPPDEPDPIAEVARQAEEILGQDVRDYRNLSQDSTRGIPREGVLTFTPEMAGVTFQPTSQNVKWTGRVPPAVFLLSARRESLGKTLRGALYVYLGNIIVAQVPLSLRVDEAPANVAPAGENYAQEGARWYRRIFASYSHQDMAIVEEFERHAIAFGDEYLRDLTKLRSGTVWNDELQRMIREADVFQLFWSDNAMRSPYVRDEYTYALGLRRESFVRPVYWQDPMPESKELGLPPAELQQIHFHRIAPTAPTPRRTMVYAARSVSLSSSAPARTPLPRPPPSESRSPRGRLRLLAVAAIVGLGLIVGGIAMRSHVATSPKSAASSFLLGISANGTAISHGQTVPSGAATLAVDVISFAPVPPDRELTVSLELHGKTIQRQKFTGKDFGRRVLKMDLPRTLEPGSYKVVLELDGRETDSFEFRIS